MGIAMHGGNRRPHIHVNLGHEYGHVWGVTGSHISTSIWATGMAIYGGNRKSYIHVNLGHRHGYIEVIVGYIST